VEILLTRRNDLKGMNLPAAPAAALGSFTAFPKTGPFMLSRLANSRRRGHFNWGVRAERMPACFTAPNYCQIKLPLKRARPEYAWIWIPLG